MAGGILTWGCPTLRGFRSVGTTSEGVGVFRDEYAWKRSPWYPPCEPRAGWGSRSGEAANKELKMGQPANFPGPVGYQFLYPGPCVSIQTPCAGGSYVVSNGQLSCSPGGQIQQQCQNGACQGGSGGSAANNGAVPTTIWNRGCTTCHVPNYKRPLSCDVDTCTPEQKAQWCANAKKMADLGLTVTGANKPLTTGFVGWVSYVFDIFGETMTGVGMAQGMAGHTAGYVDDVCK
jgi:hypothetical protein